jgi:hypothetical protein
MLQGAAADDVAERENLPVSTLQQLREHIESHYHGEVCDPRVYFGGASRTSSHTTMAYTWAAA